MFCSDGIGCSKQEKTLTSEHTTLRRHAESLHAVRPSVFTYFLLHLKPSNICVLASLQTMVQHTQLRVDASRGHQKAQDN